MTRTIVVGVDGSATSLSALRWAQALADPDALIRAIYAWTPPMASGSLAAPEQALETDARAELDAALERVPAGSVERTSEVMRDISAAGALVEASADSALLVTGTRGLTRLGRIVLGSVAVQCAQHSKVPFIAVPQLADLPGSLITVGYDDSPAANAALEWAVDWGTHRSMAVRVVTVQQQPGWRPWSTEPAPPDESDQDDLARKVRAVVGDAVDELELCVVTGTSVIDELLQASQDASLLVVGSRGLGGFAGLLLGSVSQRCLELATLPVAVIREY